MRTYRTRTTVLAAVTAALALSLTACGGEKGTAAQAGAGASGGASAAPAAAPSVTVTPSASAAAADPEADSAAASAGTRTAAAQTRATKKPGSRTAPACTVRDVKVTAAKQEGVPTTHITLTATNVSGRSCTLLKYPLIAFGDIQTAKDVPSVAKSRPATAVVLNPGAPAYAAVRISGGGVHEDNRVVSSFSVNLFAADGPAEGSKVVSAPAGGIAVNDAVAKTGYWTPELRNGADEF
ncbi:DUF4232 domain-containing protein [Streptomyces sp. NPDC047981]|uniref:DUF4232 domain-containing protein n=1 Tax=Streptomyces sp. NPDC047981 TaxID=3154610 RepID=UPI0034385886